MPKPGCFSFLDYFQKLKTINYIRTRFSEKLTSPGIGLMKRRLEKEREVNEEGLKKFIIKKLKGDESDRREVLASYDINEQEVLGSQ